MPDPYYCRISPVAAGQGGGWTKLARNQRNNLENNYHQIRCEARHKQGDKNFNFNVGPVEPT